MRKPSALSKTRRQLLRDLRQALALNKGKAAVAGKDAVARSWGDGERSNLQFAIP